MPIFCSFAEVIDCTDMIVLSHSTVWIFNAIWIFDQVLVIIFRNIIVGLEGISIMFRSPSRNQRSKGFKVKHILQICLLLAVCFWLIYQVKHSHDKKKEFDANDGKISSNMQVGNEVVKFGRKDLHPRMDEGAKSEKHGEEENEEEEEESKHDEEQEEEESKHDEEQEEEESKADGREDEGREDGSDEIDENDQEKTEEEMLEEEKEEREGEGDEKEIGEKESEEKDELSENEKEMDDRDHDDGSRNSHEAREEHYKADDASSAVAHDTQTNGGEADKMEDFDENTLERETKPDNNEVSVDHKNSKAEEVELAENEASSNVTDSQEKGTKINTPKSENNSHLNPPITKESNVLPEVSNNNSSDVNNHESPEVSIKLSDLDAKNGTETFSDSVQAQNATGEGINTEQSADTQDVILQQTINNTTATEDNQSGSELENAGATSGESLNSTNPDLTSEAELDPESLISKENTDVLQNEKQDTNSGSGGTDESSEESSSKNEGGDPIQQDPIDASDSSNPQEEKEPPPRDSNYMPEIRTDVSEKEGAVAE